METDEVDARLTGSEEIEIVNSRRRFLKTAAPALAGAAALSGSVPASSAQQGATNERMAWLKKAPVWSADYWATNGDLRLYLRRKRAAVPKAGERLPVLVLLHGSSFCGTTSYDLDVPGAEEYSVMNIFARWGYDVWTMDFSGYGQSSRSKGNANIADGVSDLKAAMPVILQETGRERVHIYGESSGALRLGAFAMARPEQIDRMALGSFTYTGKGSPTLIERAKQLDYFKTHNTRLRDREVVRGVFTRDKPGTADQAVADALASAELKFGDQVPTGTYLDMVSSLPIVDPLKIQSPTIILRGEFDGIATMEDLLDFFGKLPTGDKQLAVLPGLAHTIGFGYNRADTFHMLRAFLEMPASKYTGKSL